MIRSAAQLPASESLDADSEATPAGVGTSSGQEQSATAQSQLDNAAIARAVGGSGTPGVGPSASPYGIGTDVGAAGASRSQVPSGSSRDSRRNALLIGVAVVSAAAVLAGIWWRLRVGRGVSCA